jgi:hypothetical protein
MLAVSHHLDCSLMQDLPCPVRVMAGNLDTEFHQESGFKPLHFALPHPVRVMAGNLDTEFHQEPGSKELHFASIPDWALLQDLTQPARMIAGNLNK